MSNNDPGHQNAPLVRGNRHVKKLLPFSGSKLHSTPGKLMVWVPAWFMYEKKKDEETGENINIQRKVEDENLHKGSCPMPSNDFL